MITSVPSNIMFVFLFSVSKQHLASIFIAGTGFLKISDSIFIYTNYSCPIKPYFITWFQVLNNNTVLNGEIKFTCIYSLTQNPLYAVGHIAIYMSTDKKWNCPHCLPIQHPSYSFFHPLHFTGGLPRLKLANK